MAEPTPEEIAAADELIERARSGDASVLRAIIQHQGEFRTMKPHIEAARRIRADKAKAELDAPGGYPWEHWDPAKRQQMDKAVEQADWVQMYKNAGGAGVAPEYARKYAGNELTGGMSPEEALLLARYKQYKNVSGGDPNFQGPVNINTSSMPEHVDTEDDVKARNAALGNMSQKDKDAMFANLKLANERSYDHFFDGLAKPVERKVSPMVEQPITLNQPPLGKQQAPTPAALPDTVAVPDNAELPQKTAASLLNLLRNAGMVPSDALMGAASRKK